MKCVILAGGVGTRLSEETISRPKPMVEIGGRPILWHIMKIYSAHGVNDFVICLGYKGQIIKEYFFNYGLYQSDVTIDVSDRSMVIHRNEAEPWKVTLVETGEHSMTGGRIGRIRDHVGDETFCMTYGDGVADIDVSAEIQFHRAHPGSATLAAVRPPGRFGAVVFEGGNGRVSRFEEKPQGDGAFINGGFFVLEPDVFNLIDGDDCVWEQGPMRSLAADGQIYAYNHSGFWQAMDTLRDKNYLEHLWSSKQAKWKTW